MRWKKFTRGFAVPNGLKINYALSILAISFRDSLIRWYLEELDLGDDDNALGPHLEVKTSDRFRLKTIIRLMRSRRLQDLLACLVKQNN